VIEQQLHDQFWKPEAPDVLWNKLLVANPKEAIAGACALIRHPVPRAWVVRTLL
jgi:hypothetical protein